MTWPRAAIHSYYTYISLSYTSKFFSVFLYCLSLARAAIHSFIIYMSLYLSVSLHDEVAQVQLQIETWPRAAIHSFIIMHLSMSDSLAPIYTLVLLVCLSICLFFCLSPDLDGLLWEGKGPDVVFFIIYISLCLCLFISLYV